MFVTGDRSSHLLRLRGGVGVGAACVIFVLTFRAVLFHKLQNETRESELEQVMYMVHTGRSLDLLCCGKARATARSLTVAVVTVRQMSLKSKEISFQGYLCRTLSWAGWKWDLSLCQRQCLKTVGHVEKLLSTQFSY